MVEEQEAANEELKSSHEEALSNNEELQSTNEELETAKEELQSTNEELVTLTEQQASRNVELTRLNDDLANILDGVQIPIVILDNDRRIRRFTPSAEKLFNLLHGDIGRRIQNLRANLDLPDLLPLVERAMHSAIVQEKEVRDLEGRYYILSIRPYRTADRKVDGVLIVLADIDSIKRSSDEIRHARDYADAIVETVREALVVLDSDLHIVRANGSFYSTFRLSPKDTENRRIYDVAQGSWNIPELRRLLEEVLPKNKSFENFRLSHVFPDIGRRILLLNARRLQPWADETSGLILLTMLDRTELESATEALQTNEQRLRELAAGLLTAQEDERSRIARELHDSVNQQLAMLTIELKMLENEPVPPPKSFHKRLASLGIRLQKLSEEVNQAAYQLHPSIVDHLGLPAALRSLCDDLSKQEKIRIDYRQVTADYSASREVGLCLYRVAQEALRNVVKHSGARRASVALVMEKERIVLSIRDRGVGFDRERPAIKRGIGLTSMEERVRAVKGTLTIRSSPGAGTRVVVQIPINHLRRKNIHREREN